MYMNGFQSLIFKMSNNITGRGWVNLLLIVLCVSLLIASVPLSAAISEKTAIAVSISPQKYFVERIGGKYVDVLVMVAPGQSPATYAPTPKQMVKLSNAQIYFGIGVPFEKIWIQRIAKMNPQMHIVQMEQGLTFRSMEKPMQKSKQYMRDTGQYHRHYGEPDPHVWTNPRLVVRMAAKIKAALIEHAPTHKQEFQENYRLFVQDLGDLDEYIGELCKNAASKQFMVFHPSWGYFADAYGLRQISIESEGKLPGAKSLSSLVDFAKRENIKIIFVQQQSRQRNAATIAQAINGAVVHVDPLAENYIDNLKHVAHAFTGMAK